MGIKHIEDLKPQELLNFLMDWNRDNKNFHATEKVDGNFFSFGLKNEQFFIRTKSNTYTDSNQIPNLFFMEEFRRYFLSLKDVPLLQIAKRLSKKYNYNFKGSIEITGEAVPTHDHNIVMYNKDKIGKGIMVIFETKFSDELPIFNLELWEEMSNDINKYTDIKLYAVPTVNLSGFKFKRIVESDLRKIVGMKGILDIPARTPESKKIKEKLLNESKKLGLQAKEQMLQFQFKSLFGDEYEGIVIASKTGEMIKIIDKNKFTKRKEDNWVYVNKLMEASNEFKKNIKQYPFDMPNWLSVWKLEVSKIEKQFLHDRIKDTLTITIPKKIIETEQSIKLDFDRINLMSDMLKEKTSPLTIRELFLNKQIVPKYNV